MFVWITRRYTHAAYRKSGTQEPGRQQVGHQDLGHGTPKCLGETQDPEPKTPKYSSGTCEMGPQK